jgi:hypothetical protein
VRDHADQVVTGLLAACRQQLGHEAACFADVREALLGGQPGLGVARQRPVDGLAVGIAVLLRNADQRADHVHRKLHVELLLDVEAAGSDVGVQGVGRELADRLLEGGDAPRREALAHDVAQPRLPRRVHADDRHQLAGQLAAVLEARTERGAVGLPVERGLPDVLEAEERVEVEGRVVGTGLLFEEVPIHREGIFLERSRVRVVDHEASLLDRARLRLASPASRGCTPSWTGSEPSASEAP